MRLVNNKKKIFFQTNEPVLGPLNLNKLNKKKWSKYKRINRLNSQLIKTNLSPVFSEKHFTPKSEFRVSNLKSVFKNSLQNRQMFKHFYGNISNHFLKKSYKKALKSSKRLTMIKFLSNLESRLDVILYRVGLISSVSKARQFILHKGVKINQKTTKSSNYLVDNKLDAICFKKNNSIKTLIFVHSIKRIFKNVSVCYPFKFNLNWLERFLSNKKC